jgi:hypothetical protein
MTFLWKKSGKKFLVLYLKGCVRMVIALLNHSLYQLPKGGTEARKDRRGLPTIIPGPLRYHIRLARDEGHRGSILITRAVLTVLSFYRVMAYVAKPSLSTITDGFKGADPLFPSGELDAVLALFPKIRLGKPTLFTSESAGPNGVWFTVIQLMSLPFLPLIGVLIRGRLGSLAALKEGAGKTRIVATTDWWTASDPLVSLLIFLQQRIDFQSPLRNKF